MIPLPKETKTIFIAALRLLEEEIISDIEVGIHFNKDEVTTAKCELKRVISLRQSIERDNDALMFIQNTLN